jgi:hypothetical protein
VVGVGKLRRLRQRGRREQKSNEARHRQGKGREGHASRRSPPTLVYFDLISIAFELAARMAQEKYVPKSGMISIRKNTECEK